MSLVFRGRKVREAHEPHYQHSAPVDCGVNPVLPQEGHHVYLLQREIVHSNLFKIIETNGFQTWVPSN